MQRVPEPELMNDDAQAYTYAMADFEQPHSLFIQLFCKTFSQYTIDGCVADLGCGAADITRRFAQQFPTCHIDGLDGSAAMLQYGQAVIQNYCLTTRVRLLHHCLPNAQLPQKYYAVVISNSLLHHLANPQVLWDTIKQIAKPSAPIFVMDLMRPAHSQVVDALVRQYAANEPPILQRDFRHSLQAAYCIKEVREQLRHADLSHLTVQSVSDRHLLIAGIL